MRLFILSLPLACALALIAGSLLAARGFLLF